MDPVKRTPWVARTSLRWALPLLLLILALVIWLSPWPLLRYAAAFLFLWVLPGLGWAYLLPPRALDPTERLAVGFGLSFVVTPITILLLSYLPGPVTQVQILVAGAGEAILPWFIARAACRIRPTRKEIAPVPAEGGRAWALPRWRIRWVWVVLAVLVVVGLRIVNLNYSEFQGDEAEIALRAARALEGDETILFQHKKGPVELTLVVGTWRLTGMINEWMARLPFTWANLLGLTAVLLLCRRLGSMRLGAIAVALLAIEGYFVAFGRIVQYQNVVFALGSLGLLCLLAFHGNGQRSLVLLAAALFAGGFLAHFDAALALPAGLVLLGARLWADRRNLGQALALPLVAAGIGLALVVLYYLPFLYSPYLGNTSGYLSERVGTGFSNNLRTTFVLTAVYDSVYYIGAMLLLLGSVLMTTWARWGRPGRWLGGALLLVAVTTVLWPERWLAGQVTVAWVPHALLLLGALLAPGQSVPRRAVWVWFGVPWLFYLFLADVPLTHVHVFFAAWAILSALGLNEAARWLAGRNKLMRRTVVVLATAFYLVCAYYPIMMFVDHTPEYRRTFPEFKRAPYWTPYEQIPEHGLFGFPYRAGWKVAGYLRDTGTLVGSYDSNEELAITTYYTRQAPRVACTTPDMYITATNVQDEVPINWYQLDAYYQPGIEVTVGGEVKLVVHQRRLTSASGTYAVKDYAWQFDQGTTPERVATIMPAPEMPVLDELVEQGFILGGFARLVGYQLNVDQAVPGGYVDLVLHWEALQPAPTDYKTFTHLDNGMVMVGQLDLQPVCGSRPTTGWQPGETLVDHYRIPVRGDAPLGPVPLYLGMYDMVSGQRASVTAPDGASLGDSIHLTDIVIRGP